MLDEVSAMEELERRRMYGKPNTPAPAADHRTYETCHKHFSCPDGEECWYLSEDYYWDCGNGASRVSEASQRASRKAREEDAAILNWFGLPAPAKSLLNDTERERIIEDMMSVTEPVSTQQQAGEP